jgi:hypothetical protein
MKGRITCPKCGQNIIADVNKDIPAFALDCPQCDHHFKVKTSQVDVSNVPKDSEVDVEADCDWEEHGEPRKTILSSIKPRTDKPMIASILLILVVLIGIFSAVFPTMFLQAPVSVASIAGVNGDLTVIVDNSSVIGANDIMLSIDEENTSFVQKNDSFSTSSVSLGEHEITISHSANNSSDQTVTKQVYVLPFNLSTYSVTLTGVNPLAIEDDTLELGWLSSIILILSVVSLIGAVMSWRRKYSDVALIGSVVGIFSIGIYFSALILGVIAFWLILKSRDEFDDGKKGKSF